MTTANPRLTERVRRAVQHPIEEVHERLHEVPPHEVYEVTFEGERAVCKIGTGPTAAPSREAGVLAHVGSQTNLPVPEVLAVGENYFIAEWLNEIPEDQELTDTWAYVAGQTMARLHDQTSFRQTGRPASGTDGFRAVFHETWQETVKSLLRIRRDHLAAGGHQADAELADTALNTFQEWAAFRDDIQPVICHGNILPDHLRVDSEAAAALIDFEHAIIGPGLYDYHRSRLPLFGKKPTLESAFKQGYEAVRPLPAGQGDTSSAYEILIGVSYLRALRVQETGSVAEREERAAELRDWVHTRLTDLRDR